MKRSGFTLVELFIVLCILGILVAVVLPQFLDQPDSPSSPVATSAPASQPVVQKPSFRPVSGQDLLTLEKGDLVRVRPGRRFPEGRLFEVESVEKPGPRCRVFLRIAGGDTGQEVSCFALRVGAVYRKKSAVGKWDEVYYEYLQQALQF